REHALSGDARAVTTDVVAAGAAQAANVPGVVHLDVALRQEHVHDLRTVFGHDRLSVADDDASDDDPIGVRHATCEAPATGDDEVIAVAYGGAGRIRDERLGPRRPGEHLAGAGLGHLAGHHAGADPEHDAPARRAVGGRDHLDRAHGVEGVGFVAAQRMWDAQREDARLDERIDDVVRQVPGLLDLVAP